MERPQRKEDSPKGKNTTGREGLSRKAKFSGKEGFKEESSKKSTGKAEGRDCMAETGNGGGGRTVESQERASATTFWKPSRWMRTLVISDR